MRRAKSHPHPASPDCETQLANDTSGERSSAAQAASTSSDSTEVAVSVNARGKIEESEQTELIDCLHARPQISALPETNDEIK